MLPILPTSLSLSLSLTLLASWSVGPITSFPPFLYFHARVSVPSVCKHPDTSPIGLSPCKISVRPQVSGTGHTSNNAYSEGVFCVCVCMLNTVYTVLRFLFSFE